RCIPLIPFNETLGALLLTHPQPNFFSVDDRSIAQAATDVCATAIRNLQLADELRRISNTDSLTAVYNQRYFHIAVGQEMARSRRYRKQFSIALFDLHGLRNINAESGFETGDEVLRSAAAVLKQQLRGVDVACRYSGDQFSVVFPEIGPESVTVAVAKLKAALATVPAARGKHGSRLEVASAQVSYPEDGSAEMELVRLLLGRIGETKSRA